MSDNQNTEQTVAQDTTAGTPVFPSEYEIVSSILDQYQKQLDEQSAKTLDAIEKLKKNLRTAEDSNIAILAQRKLMEVLNRDLKKATGRV